MPSGPAATAGLLLALALVLAACGEEQTATAGGDTVERTVAAAQAHSMRRAPHRSARVEAVSAQRRCRRSLGNLLDAIESLNNTVAVGTVYDGYLSSVNHVRGAYAATDADGLSLVCLARVARPAERALNAFITAANSWGACLADAACDPGSVEPELQREWGRASDLLSAAERGLRRIG